MTPGLNINYCNRLKVSTKLECKSLTPVLSFPENRNIVVLELELYGEKLCLIIRL